MPSRENPAFVVDHLLDVRQLSFRPRPRRRRYPAHKAQCLPGSRHLIGQRPAGVISGSQQLSLLRADRRQPQYQVTRIMLIALLIAGPAGGEEILRVCRSRSAAAAAGWYWSASATSGR